MSKYELDGEVLNAIPNQAHNKINPLELDELNRRKKEEERKARATPFDKEGSTIDSVHSEGINLVSLSI